MLKQTDLYFESITVRFSFTKPN